MRYHHTKNKGDLGAIRAMADMTEKGWGILLPLTEHATFDFVAHRENRFLRVQAKYRTVQNGCATITFRSMWADRHGVHTVPLDRNAIDLICVYVPEVERCFYFDPKMVPGNSISLRVTPTRNSINKGVNWAENYAEIPVTTRGIRAGEESGLVGWGWVRQSLGRRAA